MRTPRAASLLGASVGLLLFGCGSDDGSAFYGSLRSAGEEVERFASVADMTVSADMVARGRFTAFEIGRVVGAGSGAPVSMAEATFVVEDLLAGQGPTSVPVEFVLVEAGVPIPTTARRLFDALPEEPLVLFLRNKGGAESAYYRLVNSVGLWTADASGDLLAPLAELVDGRALPYDGDGLDLESLADLQEYVASVGG